jgi:ubiquitin carboxyl-terminal hydrolase 4/11/15
VTRSAYLLFYRRRSAGPLGPPQLQEVVNAWWNPGSEGANDSDEVNSRPDSPAGNGLRLDGSSRNGSSSAFAAGAGAGALRGAGLGGAGSLALKGAEVATDDELPDYHDEGYGAGDEDGPANYGRYVSLPTTSTGTDWNFDGINQVEGSGDVFDEDASSNAPNLAGDSLGDRLLQDFGDELGDVVHHPRMGTPNIAEGMEGLTDDDVVDIRVSPED